jgi:hypothetical protein
VTIVQPCDRALHIPDPREEPTIGLEEANPFFSLGRSKSYALARSGRYPCKVLKIGDRYRVVTTSLLATVGLDVPIVEGAGAIAERNSK